MPPLSIPNSTRNHVYKAADPMGGAGSLWIQIKKLSHALTFRIPTYPCHRRWRHPSRIHHGVTWTNLVLDFNTGTDKLVFEKCFIVFLSAAVFQPVSYFEKLFLERSEAGTTDWKRGTEHLHEFVSDLSVTWLIWPPCVMSLE